jgi:hypothetical protein
MVSSQPFIGRTSEIISDNSFLQRKTIHQKGCQIDYLIHTEFNILYVFEIKFSQNKISKSVIEEVKQKIDRIKIPRGFAIKPVLIHTSEVTSDLVEERYFASIINMLDFFE